MSMSAVIDWCCEQLSSFLDCEISDDLIKYLISMENSEDVRAYLLEMLDNSNPVHCEFIDEFIVRWKSEGGATPIRYRKPDIVPDQQGKIKNSKRRGKENSQQKNDQNKESPPSTEVLMEKDPKKKQKFVSMFSQEAKNIFKIPGRNPCLCQASKHKLINNCLRCGRIVCEQEGSGPCFTCNNLVCTKEEEEKIKKGSKQGEKLLEKLMNKAELEEAIKFKNKLLEYDKTNEKQTRVIDDEADYYSVDSNNWLSAMERKELKRREQEMHSKKHRSRLDVKVTLDFAGRKVYETNDNEDLNVHLEHHTKPNKESVCNGDNGVHPAVSIIPQYEGSEDHLSSYQKNVYSEENAWLRKLRIQDDEIQRMSDEGMCLSVQQPWASFLIAGIKQHEGRTWYTPHRGRLWIHAGAKVPSQKEIIEYENYMKVVKKNNYIKFPEHYPTGCLLGCVDVKDCLPQEEYQTQYPDGDSGSPYVFICENPQELIINFPMNGQGKIFKLDSKLHQAAKKTTQQKMSKK